MKKKGIVRWFSKVKGYGFIQPDGGGAELFVHFSAIAGEGYRNLEEGDSVEYLEADDGKGPKAVGVTVMKPEKQAVLPELVYVDWQE